MSSYNLGNGEVSLLPLWQTVYLGDRPETIGGYLQEAHGGNLSQDTTSHSKKLSVPTLDVQYRRGTEIPLADALSRVTPLPTEEDGIQLPIIAVNEITANIPCSSNDLDQIREETRKDPMLKLLMHYIAEGWPRERKQLPRELHDYWNYREDMSLEDGIATKGHRILIPSTLRRKALQQIHEGHQGVEKCMLKARESVFWPGISDDIREAVNKCGTCQSSSKAAKPLGSTSEVPPHPWHTLGTDLFYWNKIDFLVIGDYFTKFIIVRRLPNSSTHSVIKELGMVFTEFGRPFILRSDNGPCYTPRSSVSSLSFIKCTTSRAAHITRGATDLLRPSWALQRGSWTKPSRMGNPGTMGYSSIESRRFPALSHHL